MKLFTPMFVSAALRRALTIGVFAALGAWAQSPPASTEILVSRLGPGFRSDTVQVNGTSVHYVRGGSGPAIILIHGFPQDWYEFRNVLPRLAQKFTVIAVDLRGVGDSAPASSGYDAANLAEDIHQLATQLNLAKPYIFGHDIGGMVAYAYARRYANYARGVMIFDVAFPGLDPWREIQGNRDFWHIRFHQTDLPEKLVTARQGQYFAYFLSPDRFSAEDVAHFANAYRDPDHLSAAFATYRAFPADEKFFSSETTRLNLPLVIGSGETDAFAPYLSRIADALRAHGISNLKTEIVPGSAHYVANEKPDLLASLIEKYAAP